MRDGGVVRSSDPRTSALLENKSGVQGNIPLMGWVQIYCVVSGSDDFKEGTEQEESKCWLEVGNQAGSVVTVSEGGVPRQRDTRSRAGRSKAALSPFLGRRLVMI